MSEKPTINYGKFSIDVGNRKIAITTSSKGVSLWLFKWFKGTYRVYFLHSEKEFNKLWKFIKEQAEKQHQYESYTTEKEEP